MQEIQEGKVKILVDIKEKISKELEVFYNPIMERNRSLSIALLVAMDKKNLIVGLPLAGTGVRAVRFAIEIPKRIKCISVNDREEKAVEVIKKNIELNKTPIDIKVSQKDAIQFLAGSRGFDYIDIDPYGSPVPYLDTAIQRISRDGILAVTATDTATLAGTYPKTCRRKYWATSVKCPQMHEIAIRILIRKVQLMGMHHGKSLTPLFSYHDEHYYRIFFYNKKGKIESEKLFNFGYHHSCNNCGYQFTSLDEHGTCLHCKAKLQASGPLYTGPLWDNNVINKMKKITQDKKVHQCQQELLVGFYDTHQLGKINKKNLVATEELISKLVHKGYKACKSASSPTGIETDAPYGEVINSIE